MIENSKKNEKENLNFFTFTVYRINILILQSTKFEGFVGGTLICVSNHHKEINIYHYHYYRTVSNYHLIFIIITTKEINIYY